MDRRVVSIYRSPGSHGSFVLEDATDDGDAIRSGVLIAQDGSRFRIEDGIPDLTWPPQLRAQEKSTIEFYSGRVDAYDKYLPLTFSTFGEQESEVRNAMVDRLNIGPGKRVLEIGAGTGRDSEVIASRLGSSGELFCQDIARSMLERNRDRLSAAGLKAHFAVANASHLPFDDKVFDAVYQFGGVGEFVDIAGFFREVVRVTKVGGRIVVGDESMPPWLRQTTFAKILATTNPQFNAPLPLDHLPIEAREVNLRWIIGGTFYLIDFTVGVGEPPADFDFEIPGPRGGTRRTRYLGQLEGVKPETKELAHKAREKLGLSMHDWLDELVEREARKVLGILGAMADSTAPGWHKRGLVFRPEGQGGWMNSHAQVPTALVLDDRIRIYLSSRPKAGLSLTGYVDLDITAPDKVIGISPTPILDLGSPGSFDEHGVMPSAVVRDGRRVRLYYSGWSRLAGTVPYHNTTGLAVSEDGGTTFVRECPGPVLDRSPAEPFSATSPCVVHHEGTWHTFYSSGLGWLEIDGKWEHVYDLRHACSADGINWQRTAQPALPQTFAEEALTRPTILRQDDGRWGMWFSHRGSRNFRSDGDAYRIGFARSNDLWIWQRDDGAAGIDVSDDGFDSEMIAYPCVIRVGSRILMFYNGNGFGRDGLAWAEWREG